MGQTNDKGSKPKTRAGRKGRAERFDGTRFVQYELDEAEKQACKAWELSPDKAWDALLGLVDDGYGVSLKFDTFSEAYACFVQVRNDPEHINAGLCLTGRGSSPYKALKQALFKMDAIGPSWVQFGERQSAVLDD